MAAVQQKTNLSIREVQHHGSEGCCTNDGLSSTRGLRRSSDLHVEGRGEENLVTPTTPVGVAKPDLHSCIGEELPGHDIETTEPPVLYLLIGKYAFLN